MLSDTLPNGIAYEWTEVTYQQILAGNTMVYVFPLVVLLVFMVLAAQYRKFTLAAGDYYDCTDDDFLGITGNVVTWWRQ